MKDNEKIEEKLHCTTERASEIMRLPECQLYIYVLLIMKLIDDGDLNNAKDFGDFVLLRCRGVNQRTLDHITAKAIYFVSVAYEKKKLLVDLRPHVFDAYKDFCLHSNQIGQATCMNVIIRSYLQQNLYEQARNFITKTGFPEGVSNNQYARYLYYVGRIKAVQLEYSEAQASLIQSQRKGPEIGATAFRLQVQKLLIVVTLLMGEIPSRSIFDIAEFKKPLYPYFLIVNCVKQGDMDKFKNLLQKYSALFEQDKTLSQVHRL